MVWPMPGEHTLEQRRCGRHRPIDAGDVEGLVQRVAQGFLVGVAGVIHQPADGGGYQVGGREITVRPGLAEGSYRRDNQLRVLAQPVDPISSHDAGRSSGG